MTSVNTSCAPGFVPIPCPSHQQYSITNICKAPNCIEPLCPECIASHVQLHQESKKPAKIENIITTRTTCIEQLAIMKYEAQKDIDQFLATGKGNIDQFVESHQRRLETAHKKVLKIVDEMFAEMGKQMQVIVNAYAFEKEKRQKELRIKLSPLSQHLQKISQYKLQLQSDDYIPALIQLLNEPPKKPKQSQPTDPINFGTVQINQKYLEDIKTDISKFVSVVVNCKDQAFKGRVQMNRNATTGSNNMKFSRFDRSRSRDRDGTEWGGDSRDSRERRSNSKKNIFGCQSVLSDVRPVTASSRIDNNNNSIYNGLSQTFVNKPQGKVKSQISAVNFSSQISPIKISKSSYFTNDKACLWYFKEGSKLGFKAPLQSIEAGFERCQLNINFLIPPNHRTLILPNGTTFLVGGQSPNQSQTTNTAYILQNDTTLKQIQPMLQSRSNFGICYIHDYIYVAGGLSSASESNKWSNKRVISQCQRYCVRENRWQKIASLPQPCYQFSMGVLDSGRVFKFGGVTETREFLCKIDVFDVFENLWWSVQPDSRFCFATSPGIVQISPNSLVIFGGRIPSRNQKTSKCFIVSQQQCSITISNGPQLYSESTFESAYTDNNSILAIQNNQMVNRNKIIMGYKYNQWKFVGC